MKSYGLRTVWLIVFALFILSSQAESRQLALKTSLGITGRYDDNVEFSRTDQIEDYSSIIEPNFVLDYQTERTRTQLGGKVGFFNYLEESEYDTVKHNYFLGHETQLNERLSGRINFSYTKDTLLDSELEETGRVFNREDRNRYFAGVGFDFALSQLNIIGADYNFSDTDYEEDIRVDRKLNRFSVYYQRKINDGLDSLIIKPEYKFRDTEEIEADYYALSAGWSHASSEVGKIRIFLGWRYIEEHRTGQDETEKSGLYANAMYEKKGEIDVFRIGAESDFKYDANDELIEVYRIYFNWNTKFSERILFNIGSSFYWTVGTGESDEDTRFFNAAPSLAYKITEMHLLKIIYRYSYEYDDVQSDKTVDRNQILLMVDFNLPFQL